MDNIIYEIKQIFMPSANICNNFARVQISRLSAEDQEKLSFYKHITPDYFNTLPPEERPAALAEWRRLFAYNNLESAYLNTWNMESNVFAFAAYVGDEMVGFTTGSLNGANMFTRSLYVLPQYQGCGIGSSLLNSAENAASLVSPKMELFSLAGAVSFYQNRGYKNTVVLGRVMKIKKLSNATGVQPVFKWCDKLQSKLNLKFDANLLQKNKHQPIFVYVNDQQKIDGIAVQTPNGEQQIKVNPKAKISSPIYTQKLSDALSRSL
ncbi:MAG: GNAT family N-acetyltransferase [Alphaproteobacteria bacterium]|nr:GNAT family N-acetyltransferase [Alphaproteobacteria bacterium]